jgi:dimethylargininase
VERALAQHDAYCRALETCGLEIVSLSPDPAHPDSPFVEDTAVLTPHSAIITRPGAPSRRGEVVAIELVLAKQFDVIHRIEPPGTLDGGDVCRTSDRVLIGLSARTNEAGAQQLAQFLAEDGLRSTRLDIRPTRSLLHLKSGMAYLGEGRLAVIDALSDHPTLAEWERVRIVSSETHAANCLVVNDHVLVAEPCPTFARLLSSIGYTVVPLDVSEFEKMDGGLSCLSLRF